MASDLSPEAEIAIRKFLENYEDRREQRRHQRTLRMAAIVGLGAAAILSAIFAGISYVAKEQARAAVKEIEQKDTIDVAKKTASEALAEAKEAIKAATQVRAQAEAISDFRDEALGLIKDARAAASSAKAESEIATKASLDAKDQAQIAAAEANVLRTKNKEATEEANRLFLEAQDKNRHSLLQPI